MLPIHSKARNRASVRAKRERACFVSLCSRKITTSATTRHESPISASSQSPKLVELAIFTAGNRHAIGAVVETANRQSTVPGGYLIALCRLSLRSE